MLGKNPVRVAAAGILGAVSIAAAMVATKTRPVDFIPVRVQRWIRDSGLGRSIADFSVLLLAAPLALSQPCLILRFISSYRWRKSFKYGENKKEKIEVFHLDNDYNDESTTNVIIFVHGGAWGSGHPWMYRLMVLGMAKCFNAKSAILVEYPVFPDSFIIQQAEAICRACVYIQSNGKELGTWSEGIDPNSYYLVGHSSGANLCALALLRAMRENIHLTDHFIGLNGVYDIGKHYEFEKGRRVHEISPMSAASKGVAEWDNCSPTLCLRGLSGEMVMRWPSTLLYHGQADSTVPYVSSREFSDALKSKGARLVVEDYPPDGDHPDCIFELTLYDPDDTTTGKPLNIM